MTSRGPRLLLGLLAAVTLALTVGGAVGAWPTGAPASRLDPASAAVMTRDMEGSGGEIRSEANGSEADGRQLGRPEHWLREQPDEKEAAAGETAEDEAAEDEAVEAAAALPARSGQGRRVVFDMSEQRVWLVSPRDRVRRTYLVSGSKHENLDPGRYAVYSRSRHAVSYTYEETMDFMVRFAHGDNAAIGFHDIPVDRRGRPVQTREQLGQPLSAGCIRQARPDAVALWKFADVGARVVVLA